MNKDKGTELSTIWKDMAQEEYVKFWKAPCYLIFIPDEDYHRGIETCSYQFKVGL